MSNRVLGLPNRVLCVSPHTDDWEIAAGGLVMALRDQGAELRVIACSAAEESVPSGLPPEINRIDAVRAGAVADIDAGNIEVLDISVRRFDERRQDILEHLVAVRNEYEPELIIGPCSTDRHQDHAVVFEEVRRAFSAQTVLGYEVPWNCYEFRADVHVRLEPSQVERKIEAIESYRSQAGRSYTDPEFIWSWARFRGMQAKLPLAEAFELIHWRP